MGLREIQPACVRHRSIFFAIAFKRFWNRPVLLLAPKPFEPLAIIKPARRALADWIQTMSAREELLTEEWDRYAAECRRLAGLATGMGNGRRADHVSKDERFWLVETRNWMRHLGSSMPQQAFVSH